MKSYRTWLRMGDPKSLTQGHLMIECQDHIFIHQTLNYEFITIFIGN